MFKFMNQHVTKIYSSEFSYNKSKVFSQKSLFLSVLPILHQGPSSMYAQNYKVCCKQSRCLNSLSFNQQE